MTVDSMLAFINQYGLLFLFAVTFLEYLNIPGFPGGVIYPVAGVWAASSPTLFMLALLVSIVAGLAGSFVLYVIGKRGGRPALARLVKKYPSSARHIERYMDKMRRHAKSTLFIAKLLPVIRTLIGLPAGVLGLNMPLYLFYSGLGILVWNAAFMLSGLLFAEVAL